MKKIILFTFAIFTSFIMNAQDDVEKTKATITKSKIEGHVYFLASDELRGRQTGSSEIDIAASYIANTLRQYNVKPVNNGSYYQQVKLQSISSPTELKLKLNGTSFKKLMMQKGNNINFNGEAIHIGYGSESEYKGKDVKGKLVFVNAGKKGDNDPELIFEMTQGKRKIARKHGAVGFVELLTIPNNFWEEINKHKEGKVNYILADENNEKKDSDISHIWLQDATGEITNQLKKAKSKLHSNLLISGIKTTNIKGRNVVGMVEGTDLKLKEEYVIYSAHYDHEGVGKPNAENDSIFNGARDNVVSTVTVLSAAENIAKYPTKRSALFILFTAEEKGLLGSKWYVEHPVIPLKKVVYCFNSDNGGYNDITKVTIAGLDRTTVGHHIRKAVAEFGLEAISDPAPEQNLFDRSDNVSFARKGIPAPTYSLGFTAFDDEIFKYYHQTRDNPDSLDYDYLFKFFSSYVLSCRLIANDPKTPFWIKGDKYYKAGEKLYAK